MSTKIQVKITEKKSRRVWRETGEVRLPHQGEYFLNYDNHISCAVADFNTSKCKIIKESTEETVEERWIDCPEIVRKVVLEVHQYYCGDHLREQDFPWICQQVFDRLRDAGMVLP